MTNERLEQRMKVQEAQNDASSSKRDYGEKYFKNIPGKYNERFLPDSSVNDGPYFINITNGFEDVVEGVDREDEKDCPSKSIYITGAVLTFGKQGEWIARSMGYQIHRKSIEDNLSNLMDRILHANRKLRKNAVRGLLNEVCKPYRQRVKDLKKVALHLDFDAELDGNRYLVSGKLLGAYKELQRLE